MTHLDIQEAVRRNPCDDKLRKRMAHSIRRIIADMTTMILRDLHGTAELREEVEAVGFEAAFEKFDDIIDNFYDSERQLIWHVEKIARYKMEKARDEQYKPAGVGHDRRRMEEEEQEQNEREQIAGHALPRRHRRCGGGVESRDCLNGQSAWNGASDDIQDDRDRHRELIAFRQWVSDEVDDLLRTEPAWLRKAVEMAMHDARYGVGRSRRPSVAAIAKAVGVGRNVLSDGLWRLACAVAVGAPDFAIVGDEIIEPDTIGRREIPREWAAATADAAGQRLVQAIFGAA